MAVALINFGCLALNLKLALAMAELRTEVHKMFAEHIEKYHSAAHPVRSTR